MDFSLSPALIIMNIAYVLNLIGLAVKNILILRLLLISAQIILIYTGYVRGNWIVMFWNSVFLIINVYRAVLLLLERRPVKMPEDLADIYDSIFYHMTDREFLRFWNIGKTGESFSGKIVTAGEQPDSVYLVMQGSAKVQNETGTVATLKRGGFIGEMSYVSNRPPAADVTAGEGLICQVWERSELQKLKIKEHALWVKMQQALGHDLVTKVNRMSEQRFTGDGSLLEKASRMTNRKTQE